jgi:hypothetical protein
MGEIVVQNETFKIKGSAPTPKEQLAIDSVLAAKSNTKSGGLSFDDEMKLMITPEEVLSDAVKGKYNKDTESFLSSPEFMRIVTEVGLSIAGGIAGVAAAPFTGGSSLVGTSIAAARVARIARPLLNLSKNKQKILAGVTGAGIGGGAGAAISQTFDPRESIVREVARGTAQGAFGEVLGFGMAGALAKISNKVTGSSIKTIEGARDVVKGLDADKLFYKEIAKIKETGKLPSKEVLDKLAGAGLTEEALKTTVTISPQQRVILESLELSDEAYKSAQQARPDFFDKKKRLLGKGEEFVFERGNIVAGKLTDQSGVELASSLAAASIGGGAFIRNAEGLGRITTIESIDQFTKVLTKDLPKIDYDAAKDGVTQFLNAQIKGNYDEIYEGTKNKLWNDLTADINATVRRADGSMDPAYDVVIRGPEVPKTIRVRERQPNGQYQNKDVSNLDDYIYEAQAKNIDVRNPDISDMLAMVGRLEGRADYNRFKNVYTAIGDKKGLTGTASSVRAELLKRMESMLANSPLPAAVNTQRVIASGFTSLGKKPFQQETIKKLLNSQMGQETLYKNIIGAGKPSYFRSFNQSLDDAKFKVAGKEFDVFPNRLAIRGALQGQFLKDFLNSSVDKAGQYFNLNKTKAEKFLKDYDWLLGNDPVTGKPVGFLAQSQIKGIKDYVRRIQMVEGKIKPPGSAGTSGEMLVQMKQAGAISQIVGVVGFSTGTIDPGAATFFVLGPTALAYALSRPSTTKALIDGLGGASKGIGKVGKIDSFPKLERYIGQLGSALVAEGVIGAQEAEAAINQLNGNKEAFEKYFKTGVMPNAPATRQFDPENAPAIQIDPYLQSGIQKQGSGQRVGSIVGSDTSNIPLPNITPSNLPMGGQPNTELAQALNLFNKGGIVSAKKNF